MANVLDQDADVLIRAGWRNARWLEGAVVIVVGLYGGVAGLL